MGYERNDRPYGAGQGGFRNDRDYDPMYGRSASDAGRERDRFGGRDRDDRFRSAADQGRSSYGRDQGRSDYGRQPQGYDYNDRGFFDRAGDEVRSWFGDDEAERRRRMDERFEERDHGRSEGSSRDDRSRSYADPAVYSGGGGYGRSGAGSDYGAGRGAGATSSFGMGAAGQHDDWGRDPNYRSWRDRQVESFDRDYDEYRREHQSKFESEFHGWRQNRQTQRDSLSKVQEHQEIVGSDGGHVGTVDKVRGDRIILTKKDQDAGGHHHSIPSAWIKSVDDKVTISKTADEAHAHWRDEERNSAFGYGDQKQDQNRSDQNGPHTLNKSFSGTY